jgi:hypothetical protein
VANPLNPDDKLLLENAGDTVKKLKTMVDTARHIQNVDPHYIDLALSQLDRAYFWLTYALNHKEVKHGS